MAKIKEDKRREIVRYLNKELKKENYEIDKITADEVINKFTDKQYKKKEIESLLEELYAEKSLIKKEVNLNVILPIDMKNIFDKKYKKYISQEQGPLLFLALLLSAFTLEFLNEAADVFFYGLVIFAIFAWIITSTYQWLSKKWPMLSKLDLKIVITMSILGVVLWILLVLIKHFIMPSLVFETEHILAIFTISILGGIPLHKYIFKDNNSW